jgi:hypothetical protein
MDHILTKCKIPTRQRAWDLANTVWPKRHDTPIPENLGDIIGCGLAKFKSNNKPDKGKNRLYRILVSETAYIIWKTRNERRIRDGDGHSPNGSRDHQTMANTDQQKTDHRQSANKHNEIREEGYQGETS